MKKNTEKISIIIRTKNEERWIEQCLKKIFDQNYDNFEVILVDNNSKDNTLKKAKKFPIKVVKINKFSTAICQRGICQSLTYWCFPQNS